MIPYLLGLPKSWRQKQALQFLIRHSLTHKVSFVSHDFLAGLLHCTRRHVIRILNKLRSYGFISWQSGKKEKETNIYSVSTVFFQYHKIFGLYLNSFIFIPPLSSPVQDVTLFRNNINNYTLVSVYDSSFEGTNPDYPVPYSSNFPEFGLKKTVTVFTQGDGDGTKHEVPLQKTAPEGTRRTPKGCPKGRRTVKQFKRNGIYVAESVKNLKLPVPLTACGMLKLSAFPDDAIAFLGQRTVGYKAKLGVDAFGFYFKICYEWCNTYGINPDFTWYDAMKQRYGFDDLVPKTIVLPAGPVKHSGTKDPETGSAAASRATIRTNELLNVYNMSAVATASWTNLSPEQLQEMYHSAPSYMQGLLLRCLENSNTTFTPQSGLPNGQQSTPHVLPDDSADIAVVDPHGPGDADNIYHTQYGADFEEVYD